MPAATGPTALEIAASAIFCIAILHTFATKYFGHLAHTYPRHAGLWHLLGEVEIVFGFWAMVFILFLTYLQGATTALGYLEAQRFTESAFIFVVMVVAASRPVLDFSGAALLKLAKLIPMNRGQSYFFVVLTAGPMLGSVITEPAAMTLTAMLLRERFFSANAPSIFKYATVGTLFVNVSIGGTLTHFAAPPVLMVSQAWGWDTPFMLQHFGWKVTLALIVNAAALTYMYRLYLKEIPAISLGPDRPGTPSPIVFVHLLFLAGVVVAESHPVAFVGMFLFFLGFAEAYRKYQSRLILREGLLVGFFLGGLVVLGGMQRWWLQPLLSNMEESVLYFGATILTAFTDNAALTYLGSLVDGMPLAERYALVAGAVTGGGLTVIANAPNPAGFALLKGTFDDGAISPLGLAIAALPPTLVAVVAFRLLPMPG